MSGTCPASGPAGVAISPNAPLRCFESSPLRILAYRKIVVAAGTVSPIYAGVPLSPTSSQSHFVFVHLS